MCLIASFFHIKNANKYITNASNTLALQYVIILTVCNNIDVFLFQKLEGGTATSQPETHSHTKAYFGLCGNTFEAAWRSPVRSL